MLDDLFSGITCIFGGFNVKPIDSHIGEKYQYSPFDLHGYWLLYF